MRINYSQKIEKIYTERISMLTLVKEKISNNNNILSDELNDVYSVLKADEQNSKEYKAIIKSKEIIFQLTEDIAKANDIETIVKLRKKVNYYVNKIKKEILKRNINQDVYKKMYDDVVILRKNVAGYIRFLKRENNLIEIEQLYKSFNDLDDESKIRFKNMINNELRFNNRFIKSMNKPHNDINNYVDEQLEKSNEDIDFENFSSPSSLEVENDTNIPNFSWVFENNSSDMVDNLNTAPVIDVNFLVDRTDRYLYQYNFSELLDYDGNFLKKLTTFFCNIPRYNWNKKVIKTAEYDYNVFYHGQDLGCFIDYSKKRNSIRTALSIIFKSSRLSEREIECLSNHEKCKEWINEFYNQQNINQNNINLIRSK